MEDGPQINDEIALLLSVDIGFTASKVCLRFEGRSVPSEQKGEVYVIKFPAVQGKDADEFPTTVKYTDRDEWKVGQGYAPWTPDIILDGIKSGLLGKGHKLYGPQARDKLSEINDIRKGKDLGEVHEVHVLEQIFRHAMERGLKFILAKLPWVVNLAMSKFPVHDEREAVELIPRDCVLTYPVRDSEVLRLQMANACSAAGFRAFYLVAESVAAGCYAFLHGDLGLPDEQPFIVCDFGGATIVRLIPGDLVIFLTNLFYQDVAVMQMTQGRLTLVCPTDGKSPPILSVACALSIVFVDLYQGLEVAEKISINRLKIISAQNTHSSNIYSPIS